MAVPSWISQFLLPFVTALFAAFLFHFFAGKREKRAARREHYLKAYDISRDSLEQYQEWLVRLRHLVDPFDRRRIGGGESLTKHADPSTYLSEIDWLESERDAGQRMVKVLSESQQDLEIVDDAFLASLKALVGEVTRYWRELMRTRPRDSQGGVETVTWILARDALERGELEAEEIFRAETIVSAISVGLRLDHGRRIHGEKTAAEDASEHAVVERDGRLVLAVALPFQSPEYLAAKDSPPWESQTTAEPASS